MATLQEDIQSFICNRIEQAYQEIIDESEFKKLRKNIIDISEQIRQALPLEIKENFEQYGELIGQRNYTMEKEAYRLGFIDGLKITAQYR